MNKAHEILNELFAMDLLLTNPFYVLETALGLESNEYNMLTNIDEYKKMMIFHTNIEKDNLQLFPQDLDRKNKLTGNKLRKILKEIDDTLESNLQELDKIDMIIKKIKEAESYRRTLNDEVNNSFKKCWNINFIELE